MNPDTRLNHYRIVAPLGEGGMGQVYRAEDTRLKRQVAIKVLPAELASDPERLARLEREAQLLAQLEHPNVAAVYGLEESGTTRFLVMQLAEGETLADRLVAGPVPVEEAVGIARQIAEGLEAAHERGIVHRDLKPANVMLGPDGTVKVLDFGLAKALGPEASQGATELTASPTVLGATAAGVIMGTAGYMSPEQARGRNVDRRADIWAFGCVLWEMLTGDRLFDGETVTDVIAAVMTREPDEDRLPAATPPVLRQLLQRCLERDARLRLRDIGEARIALAGGALFDEASAPTGDPDTGAARRPPLTTIALVGVVGAVLGAAALWSTLQAGSTESVATGATRVTVEAPEWGDVGYSSGVYLTPDGRTLGYHDRDTGALRLRDLDGWGSRVVLGTEGSRDGFFSPDGRWFAYKNDGTDSVEKILVDGGTPVTLVSDVGVFNSGVWGRSGNLYFSGSVGNRDGLWRLREDGSGLELLVGRDGGNIGWFLDLLPDENALLFTGATDDRESVKQRIDALMLADNSIRTVLGGGRQARYVADGFLAVVTPDNDLAVAPFDPDAVEVRGALRRAETGLRFDREFNARYTVSARGSLAYLVAPGNVEPASIAVIDPDGTVMDAAELAFPLAPAWYSAMAIAPGGRSVAVTGGMDAGRQMWLVDTERGARTPVDPVDGATVVGMRWSRDGERLALVRNSEASFYGQSLWVMPADGSEPAVRLADFPDTGSGDVESLSGRIWIGNWAPDSRSLIVARATPSRPAGIWVVPTDPAAPPQPYLQTEFDTSMPSFSPSGDRVAYVSTRTGRTEVYVRPYPGPGREIAVSSQGGVSPVWRPDGGAIYFLGAEGIMSAEIGDGAEPDVGAERLFAPIPMNPQQRIEIDESTGRLFTVLRPPIPDSDEIRLVLDWGAELNRNAEAER